MAATVKADAGATAAWPGWVKVEACPMQGWCLSKAA